MEVRLSPEGERLLRQAVERGQFASAAHAVEVALRLLQTRDATGPSTRAVALGLEQVLAGRSTALTADDLIRRALRRGSLR